MNIADEIASMAFKFETEYPSINLFVQPSNKKYDSRGRYHSKQESDEVSELIQRIEGINLIPISFDNFNEITKILDSKVFL